MFLTHYFMLEVNNGAKKDNIKMKLFDCGKETI